jgi:starvation-inducible DNA-binding protein
LEEPVRLEMTTQLNQLLADTMTLRDLYKKSQWQVPGPTFYRLHLLFDKHFNEQVELVDSIAERIQLLGGVSISMALDVARQTVIRQTRELARRTVEIGDDGTKDLHRE